MPLLAGKGGCALSANGGGTTPPPLDARLHGHDDRGASVTGMMVGVSGEGGCCLCIGLGFFAALRMTIRQAQGHNFTVDHIVSQSKGGTDHIDNLQLLCNACNSMKGTKTQEESLAALMWEGIR